MAENITHSNTILKKRDFRFAKKLFRISYSVFQSPENFMTVDLFSFEEKRSNLFILEEKHIFLKYRRKNR